jgi:hypothetical protein
VEDAHAVAALYAASQLEELGVLRVCDRLVELHLRGGLMVGATSDAAALLDAYWLGRTERIAHGARRALYDRVLGASFDHLLGRLASAITDYDNARRAEEIAWAAGELRSFVGAHLDDDARDAVALLDAQLAAGLAILSEPEILGAYGARDAWQLTEHLARLEIGGPPGDAVRRQALAAAGTVLLAWLSEDEEAVDEDTADAAEAYLNAAAMPGGTSDA